MKGEIGMAEQDKKNNQVPDIENEEQKPEKKGFFKQIWEGIKGFFSALKEFVSDLFRPKHITLVDEIKKDPEPDVGENKDDKDLEQGQEEEIDTFDLENALQNAVEEKSLFENEEIANFVAQMEKSNPNIINRMEAMMKFPVTDENKEDFSKLVLMMTDIFNNKEEAWIKSVQAGLNKKSQGFDMETVGEFKSKMEAYNKFVQDLTGKENALDEETMKMINNFVEKKAKANFEYHLDAQFKALDSDEVKEEDFNKLVSDYWGKVVAGEIDEGEALKAVLTESGLNAALEAQYKREQEELAALDDEHTPNELEEDELEDDEYDDIYEEGVGQPEDELSGDKFAKILEGCKKDSDGRYIFEDVKTINSLINLIKTDPEEPNPEMEYVRKTLIEARNIVAAGDKAAWNTDGAEKFVEPTIADSVLDGNGVIVEDDEEITNNDANPSLAQSHDDGHEDI